MSFTTHRDDPNTRHFKSENMDVDDNRAVGLIRKPIANITSLKGYRMIYANLAILATL